MHLICNICLWKRSLTTGTHNYINIDTHLSPWHAETDRGVINNPLSFSSLSSVKGRVEIRLQMSQVSYGHPVIDKRSVRLMVRQLLLLFSLSLWPLSHSLSLSLYQWKWQIFQMISTLCRHTMEQAGRGGGENCGQKARGWYAFYCS